MVIKNARLIDNDSFCQQDITIEEGKIKKIGTLDEEGLDLEGRWLLPGLIDLNVRPKDNRISSTNLKALEKEAFQGGVTSLALIGDGEPKIDEEIALEFVKSQSKIISPLAMALKDEGHLAEISILTQNGALSFYLASDTNSYLLARIFEYAKMHHLTLHIDPKNHIFRDVGVMNEGEVSFSLGLGGISKLEEYSEVAKILEFSHFYEVEVLFKNISTKRALELITQSRFAYAEVSVHHLLLSDEACNGFNTLAKISPPLRDKKEQEELLIALAEGKIDLLTSLHSPVSSIYKDISFDEASFGIDALGYYLPLLYTSLIQKNILKPQKMVELASSNPAIFLGRKVGQIKEGFLADFVIFNPEGQTEVKGVSPYSKQVLQGAVEGIIKEGVLYPLKDGLKTEPHSSMPVK